MNEINNYLSICIPTYNRADVLKYNLSRIVPIVRRDNIAIYISNNASTDDTVDIVQQFKKEYRYIYIKTNKSNVGYADNFKNVLQMSKSKFSWLLGDDDTITNDSCSRILEYIKEYPNSDFIVLNGNTGSNVNIYENHIFKSRNDVLYHLVGHLFWMSSLVLSYKFMNNTFFNNISNNKDNAFAHTIALLKGLPLKTNVIWINDILVKAIDERRSSYDNFKIRYFIRDWYEVADEVKSFYTPSAIKRLLNDSPLSMRYLVWLRMRKQLNYKSFIELWRYIAKYPYGILYVSFAFICLMIPSGGLSKIKRMKDVLIR